MHWSLADLREMDREEYGELLTWAQQRNQRGDPESVDADAIVQARQAKDAKGKREDDTDTDG